MYDAMREALEATASSGFKAGLSLGLSIARAAIVVANNAGLAEAARYLEDASTRYGGPLTFGSAPTVPAPDACDACEHVWPTGTSGALIACTKCGVYKCG